MRKLAITLILLAILPLSGIAQSPHAILKSFNAIKQTNGVVLKWVIKGGQQCRGTKVFRENAEGVFVEIGSIPGLCGDFTKDETITFFDSEPVRNSINTYRLELGFQGLTEPRSVFFEDFGREDHVVFSDQFINSHRIMFTNNQSKKVLLEVFNRNGTMVYSESGTGSDFLIQASGFQVGPYFFRITGIEKNPVQGKLYFGGK